MAGYSACLTSFTSSIRFSLHAYVYTSKKTLSERWFASAELLNLYLTKYGLSCLNCSRKKTTAC
ncbi:hypothetical protein DRC65_21175 [Salmonella enterica subsp. enterica serovar Anatum]|nr:hypothetical protein [Salmonella enterica subsp. enterica serovar Anatum]ECU2220771.1 hypothetical protein [Salmonella enterica subsp. enterica serovar Anatum]